MISSTFPADSMNSMRMGRCSVSTSIFVVCIAWWAPKPAMARVARGAGAGLRGGSPGHPFVKQQRQNGVAQGAKVVLRVLVDKNRDLLCRALQIGRASCRE